MLRREASVGLVQLAKGWGITMSRVIDITGSRFGRLLVLSLEGSTPAGHTRWKCVCDCGKTITVLKTNLTSGATRSCGCLRAERAWAL